VRKNGNPLVLTSSMTFIEVVPISTPKYELLPNIDSKKDIKLI
jgi:hypothetical protein